MAHVPVFPEPPNTTIVLQLEEVAGHVPLLAHPFSIDDTEDETTDSKDIEKKSAEMHKVTIIFH